MKKKVKRSNFEELHETLNAYIFHQLRNALKQLPTKEIGNDYFMCYIIVSPMDDFEPRQEKIIYARLNEEDNVVLGARNGDEFVEGEWDFRDITDLANAIDCIEREVQEIRHLGYVDIRVGFGLDMPYFSHDEYDEQDLQVYQHINRCKATIVKHLKNNGNIKPDLENHQDEWAFTIGDDTFIIQKIDYLDENEFFIEAINCQTNEEETFESYDLDGLEEMAILQVVMGNIFN